MLAFKAYALMSKRQFRSRDNVQIASADVNVDWGCLIFDQNPANDLKDPATNRTVDRLSYTEYLNGEKVGEGQDATASHEAVFPYEGFTAVLPSGTKITQNGPAVTVVIDGIPDDHWTIFFDVIRI